MGPRVLIVEDNPDNLKLMSYLLRAFGHQVLTAGDGVEGLEVARREVIDLIVCDVHLPRLDGCEVARQLKAHPGTSRIPLVAVTALAMVGDRDKVLAAGFDGYISKPIVPRTFVGQVEAFLGQHPSRQLPMPPPAEPGTPEPSPRRGTVLVVDNTAVNIELARKILEPFGYEVLGAATIRDALALARETHPDVILSDLHLCRESGFDLIRAVKADPALRTIPYVFLSSTVFQEGDQRQGLALGADKFLIRPIAPQNLLAEIEDCLAQQRRP
jgi:two-component system, cell cycle response regulator